MNHKIGNIVDYIEINKDGVFISSGPKKELCEYKKSGSLTKIYKNKGIYGVNVELLKLYYFHSRFVGEDFWSKSIRYATQSNIGREIFKMYTDKKKEIAESGKYKGYGGEVKLNKKLMKLDEEMCKELAKYIVSETDRGVSNV